MKQLLLLAAICLAGTTYAQQIWENFDDERNVNYGFIHGVFTQNAANPDNGGINTSATCGSYVRNASEQFDVLVVEPPALMDSLTDYVNGTKQITMDVYSPAVGVTIQITLEDATTALPGNYPTGRHSIYLATTTVANQWETVTFTFDSQPDPLVPDDAVELLVLLFNPDSFTGDTYYWDNLNGPEFPDPCGGVGPDNNIFEDYECQRNISYDFMDGWLTVDDNPSMTGVNTSTTAGKYVRNAFFQNAAFGGELPVELDLTTTNQVKIDVYDYNAPTNVLLSLQDANNEVVLEKTWATVTSNTWETLNMDLSGVSPAASSGITKWVLLVNPGNFASDSVWIDNFRLEGFIPTSTEELAQAAQSVRVYPNPAKAQVNVQLDLSAADNVQFTLTDCTGRVVAQERSAFSSGVQQWSWQPTANVANGLYFLTVRGTTINATRQLQLNR